MRRIGTIITIVAVLEFAVACGSDATTPATPEVASIEMTFTGSTVSIGAVQDLDLAFLDKAGNVITGGQTATWTSSNPAIASVDAAGNVRGVALGGPVTITAAAAGKTATANLSVIPATVSITPMVTTLLVGTTVHLTATALDATQLPIAAGPAIWGVSPAGVASVDATGLLTALSSGTVTVSATISGRSATTQILAGVPSIYDGDWAGPPTQIRGESVHFTVIFGTVTGTLLSGISLGNCAATSMSIAGTQPIVSDQFLLFGQGSAQVTDLSNTRTVQNAIEISGAFASPTTMSGVIGVGGGTWSFGSLACPNSSVSGVILGTPVAYTATKQ